MTVQPGMPVSAQKRGFLFECKARGRMKSGAYFMYVSIFSRPSNAAIGQKDRFWMGTTLPPAEEGESA